MPIHTRLARDIVPPSTINGGEEPAKPFVPIDKARRRRRELAPAVKLDRLIDELASMSWGTALSDDLATKLDAFNEAAEAAQVACDALDSLDGEVEARRAEVLSAAHRGEEAGVEEIDVEIETARRSGTAERAVETAVEVGRAYRDALREKVRDPQVADEVIEHLGKARAKVARTARQALAAQHDADAAQALLERIDRQRRGPERRGHNWFARPASRSGLREDPRAHLQQMIETSTSGSPWDNGTYVRLDVTTSDSLPMATREALAASRSDVARTFLAAVEALEARDGQPVTSLAPPMPIGEDDLRWAAELLARREVPLH